MVVMTMVLGVACARPVMMVVVMAPSGNDFLVVVEFVAGVVGGAETHLDFGFVGCDGVERRVDG